MAKKPVRQALTQELMDHLSSEGYCFDAEHSKDIEQLTAEVARLTEELKKRAPVEDFEKLKADTQKEIKEKKDRIYDLEDELEKAKDEVNTLRDMWNEGERKLVTLKSELEKEARKKGTCFDPHHGFYSASRQAFLNLPQLMIFSKIAMSVPSIDRVDPRILVSVPDFMVKCLEEAIEAVGSIEELAKMLRKGQKDGT